MSPSNPGERKGAGSLLDWTGRHPRTLTLLVLLVVAGIAYAIGWHKLPAKDHPLYELVPILVLAVLLYGLAQYPEVSPHVEFFGSKARGRDSLLLMNFPGIKRGHDDEDRIKATELRLSSGRIRLRWHTKLTGLTEQMIDAAAVKAYRHHGAVTHTLRHKPGRYWELTFYRRMPNDPLAQPVTLRPEDWS